MRTSAISAILLLLGVFGSTAIRAEGHLGHKAGGELKQGRYIGAIELESKRLAVVADFYQQSPNGVDESPALHAALKVTLGGYNTHEYVTEIFRNILYDFDNGVLTLDEPENDTVITAEVHNVGNQTLIAGDVFIRSSAVAGKLSLTLENDEPGGGEPNRGVIFGDDDEPGAEKSLVPLLDGQYEGTCGGERTVLQIQTVRGLKTIWQGEDEATSLSRYYGISARIGSRDSIMCGTLSQGVWCSLYNYGGGSYNYYTGKLLLKGPSSTDECKVTGDSIRCQVTRTQWNKSCDFRKVKATLKPVKFFSRSYHVSPAPGELLELPPPNPPKNSELASALRGAFTGYVHNETTDTYQYLRLNVTAFSFTENPHNQNEIMVSTTATIYLDGPGGPFITQRYEPRSFYLRPGFTLTGPRTDSFINISEWKRGLIRGVLYSHAFGRVGTVELIKRNAPAPAPGMKMVRSFTGEFVGPVSSEGFVSNTRWFKLLFPAQPNDLTDNLVRIAGAYNPVVSILPIRNIERGTFDPFTGAFGWIIERNGASTFASGAFDAQAAARVYWPPSPDIFGAYMGDYTPDLFARKQP